LQHEQLVLGYTSALILYTDVQKRHAVCAATVCIVSRGGGPDADKQTPDVHQEVHGGALPRAVALPVAAKDDDETTGDGLRFP
jgi:hypothetical protein